MVAEGPFHTLLICPREDCKGFNFLTKYVMKTYIADNQFTFCKKCCHAIETTPELRAVAREIRA